MKTKKLASELKAGDQVFERDGYMLEVLSIQSKGSRVLVSLDSHGMRGVVSASLKPSTLVNVFQG